MNPIVWPNLFPRVKKYEPTNLKFKLVSSFGTSPWHPSILVIA